MNKFSAHVGLSLQINQDVPSFLVGVASTTACSLGHHRASSLGLALLQLQIEENQVLGSFHRNRPRGGTGPMEAPTSPASAQANCLMQSRKERQLKLYRTVSSEREEQDKREHPFPFHLSDQLLWHTVVHTETRNISCQSEQSDVLITNLQSTR